MQLKNGTVIAERYEIIAPVKAGGMGAVYKATDSHFRGRIVALKVMHDFPDMEEDNTDLIHRKFEEEANILIGLSHHQIPRVLDHFYDDDYHYIVMDFIEGKSLDTLLKETLTNTGQPLSQVDVVNYAIQVLNVIEYLHKQEPKPIVHRDIKPGNLILREENNEIVLVDFGVARGIAMDSATRKTSVGTIGYAPMEQFQGQAEPRSDIYALGATMHHLISGKAPLPFNIKPIEKVFPSVYPPLARIINKAIHNDFRFRYKNAAGMRLALKKILPHLEKWTPGDPVEEEQDDYQVAEFHTQQMDTARGGTGFNQMLPTQLEHPAEAPPSAVGVIPHDKPSLLPSPVSNFSLPIGVIVLLILAGIGILLLYHGSKDLFPLFAQSSKARTQWQCVNSQGVKSSGNSIIIECPQVNSRSGVLFKRISGPGLSPPRELKFHFRNIKGNPSLVVFVGRQGLLWSDDVTLNRYRINILKMTNVIPGNNHWLRDCRWETLSSGDDETLEQDMSHSEPLNGLDAILKLNGKFPNGSPMLTAEIKNSQGEKFLTVRCTTDYPPETHDGQTLGIILLHSGQSQSDWESMGIRSLEVED